MTFDAWMLMRRAGGLPLGEAAGLCTATRTLQKLCGSGMTARPYDRMKALFMPS